MSVRENLRVSVNRAEDLSTEARAEVVAVCNAAFTEKFDSLFSAVSPDTLHFLGRVDGGALAAHALVAERAFRIGDFPPLRCAYLKAVAVLPEYQGRGFGGRVVDEALCACREIFDIAGLSTFIPAWYACRGWEPWTGPLFLEKNRELLPSIMDSRCVMVFRLPKTPEISPDMPLVADWEEGAGW